MGQNAPGGQLWQTLIAGAFQIGEYVPAGQFNDIVVPFGQNAPETQLLQVEELCEPREDEKRPVSQGRQDDATD
jgi:hypothetical protein